MHDMYHKNRYSEKVQRYIPKQKRTTVYRFYRPPLPLMIENCFWMSYNIFLDILEYLVAYNKLTMHANCDWIYLYLKYAVYL